MSQEGVSKSAVAFLGFGTLALVGINHATSEKCPHCPRSEEEGRAGYELDARPLSILRTSQIRAYLKKPITALTCEETVVRRRIRR